MSIVEKAVDKLGRRVPGKSRQSKETSGKQATSPEARQSGDVRSKPAVDIEVDRANLRDAGFLAPENYERQLAEEYRRIKRPLLANAFGIGVPKIEFGNLIMVASALSGEGKTHTCINLALSHTLTTPYLPVPFIFFI